MGAVEETTDEELRALFELHFFAPAALTRLVLPTMREQGGAIVQMSSVGGQVTAPGFAYCATKFALEGLTETLRDEVREFGIHTLIVEPGAFRTGLFRPGAAYESAEMPEYSQTASSPATPPRPPRRSSRRWTPSSRPCASCSAPMRSATSAPGSTGSTRS